MFFLVFEVGIFLIMYSFGPKSIKTLYDVYHQKVEIQEEIALLRAENNELLHSIGLHRGLFYREKIAREQLLMKRDDETVYFIKSTF